MERENEMLSTMQVAMIVLTGVVGTPSTYLVSLTKSIAGRRVFGDGDHSCEYVSSLLGFWIGLAGR